MARYAVCLLGFAVLAAGLDDGAALVQRGLRLHSQQDGVADDLEEDSATITQQELNATLDTFALRTLLANQDGYLTTMRFHGLGYVQKDLGLKQGVKKTPPAVLAELARSEALPPLALGDLPREVQEMVADARGALAAAEVFPGALPTLRQRLPSSGLLPEAGLEQLGRQAEAALGDWAKGGQAVEEVLGTVPRLYQVLQDESLFSAVDPIVRRLDPSSPDSLVRAALQWEQLAAPSTRAAGLFGRTPAPGNATRDACFSPERTESYVRGQVTAGVKWYPSSNAGYHLTIEAGSKIAYYQKEDLGAVPCYNDAVVRVTLERRNVSGVSEAVSADLRFQGEDGHPLAAVKQRALALRYAVGEPFSVRAPGTTNKTTVFNAHLSMGVQAGAVYSDGNLYLRRVPRNIVDEIGGWKLGNSPSFGLVTAEGKDHLNIRTVSGIYPEGTPRNVEISQSLADGDEFWPF